MFKTLLFLVLLAVVNCEMENKNDLDSVIKNIFGTSHGAEGSLVNKKEPSTLVTSLNNNYIGKEDLSCTMEDGTTGQCVPFYLCDENNTIVDDYDDGLIDSRVDRRSCSSYLNVCCLLRDVQENTINKPTTQPTSDDTLDVLIKEIFGPSHTNATEEPLVDKPSAPVPSTNSKNSGEEDLSCTMDDGTVGQCVPYFLCNTNYTIMDDSAGVIDGTNSTGTSSDTTSVGGKPCSLYVNVCCLPRDVQQHEKDIEPPPQPTREGCGWRNPRGVDLRTTDETDEKAKFGEFPWMVAIMEIEPVNETEPDVSKSNVYLCGGSLIAPNVVLTLAHCVADAGALRIRAGEWDIQNTKEIYPFQDRDVAAVELHKDFDKRNLYDAALLFLSEPVTLAPNVGVACLPSARLRTPAGIQCFATGWGKNKYGKDGRYQNVLKKIELTVVKQKDCQRALRETHLGRFFQLHNSFVCAGGEEGKGTCLGDEGSPLSCSVPFYEERYIQSGIVSWGIGCGEPDTPGVYVDVSTVREWIDYKMLSKGLNPRIYSI